MHQLGQESVQAVEEHGTKGVINSAQRMAIHVHDVIRQVTSHRCVAAR